MKCPWCGSKIGSEHQKKKPWVRGDKTGQGFYQCPRCDKSSVHRYEANPLIIFPLFVVGAMSIALPFGATFFFSSVLGLGYDLSIAAGVVLFVSLIVALWFYSFQPLEVKAE
jgi:endogenous inhibitor of DNA gyrase (YacG/DUF329 family)